MLSRPAQLSSCFPYRKLIAIVTIAALCIQPECVLASPAATIYQQKCAGCHGTDGSGVTDRYETPLHGEASIDELAEQIAETMPEDDPESCVGEEARQVAEYIYHDFYSHEARLAKGLISAPRIELIRLTVPQYRNAVADLLAAFTPPISEKKNAQDTVLENAPGLQAAYFQSKKMNKTDKWILNRIDPQIDFDFANNSPVEGMQPDQFAIIWQGSLQARHTGYYDFRIHSPNGVRLFLNPDPTYRHGKLRDDSSETIQARLIDGWVSSGEQRTLSGRTFLLGGRRYSIRVEFFKYLESTASVHLEWKPPHGVWSTLDQRVLSSASVPRTFVNDTPFPADDRSVGYERGSSISQQWHTAVANGAMATAEEVLGRLPLLSGVRTESKNRKQRLADFNARLASAAYRRPLTPDEDKLFRETLFQDDSPEVAVRRAVLLMLTSPHFLYTDLSPADSPPTSHTVASRLAFALWDSFPDDQLLRLANLNRLATAAQVESQADRMLADPRSRTKLHGFFRHWLELEDRDLAKDKQLYPEFNEAVIADLRLSLEMFLDQVVWSHSSDYRELLQADYLLLNQRLQKLYSSGTTDAGEQFVAVESTDEGRSGILTHPYLLSAFSYHNNTSPIHRGVFLTRNIIGRHLKPPPVAVAFNNSDFPPDLTMREKVTELTRDQACLSCHEVINPLGFALENYDAVGRLRTVDNNKPIDTRSQYTSAEGATLAIDSARDIADFAAANPAAHRAFVTQVFQHMIGQNPAAYGPETIDQLCQEFAANEFHIQKLLVRIATLAATHVQTSPSQTEPQL